MQIIIIKNFLLINYDDLTKDPSRTINKIYNYYGITPFKHSFKKLKKHQPLYNDSVLGAPMHELKSGPIRKINYNMELPESVINKYGPLNKLLFDLLRFLLSQVQYESIRLVLCLMHLSHMNYFHYKIQLHHLDY